jgi:hypothetical protein
VSPLRTPFNQISYRKFDNSTRRRIPAFNFRDSATIVSNGGSKLRLGQPEAFTRAEQVGSLPAADREVHQII